MRLIFIGKINKKSIDVNLARFVLACGQGTLHIDRHETELEVCEDGTFSMVWSNCYIWGINDEFPFTVPNSCGIDTKAMKKILDYATVTFEMDEDTTDEDFEIEDLQWAFH